MSERHQIDFIDATWYGIHQSKTFINRKDFCRVLSSENNIVICWICKLFKRRQSKKRVHRMNYQTTWKRFWTYIEQTAWTIQTRFVQKTANQSWLRTTRRIARTTRIIENRCSMMNNDNQWSKSRKMIRENQRWKCRQTACFKKCCVAWRRCTWSRFIYWRRIVNERFCRL